MRTLVVDHPLVTHKLTALRDSASDTATFRSLTAELVTLLAYEATREIRVQPVSVTTPVGVARGVKLARPVPLIVPVLRAGIGMLEGMIRLLPMADVGFVGLRRDEESLIAETYADRLPTDLTDRDTFVLDPMLATGGTLATVISMLVTRGAASVTAICLLAAPEGLPRGAGLRRRRGPRSAGGHRHRGGGRAAERARLHRAGTGRRGRPAVRQDLGEIKAGTPDSGIPVRGWS